LSETETAPANASLGLCSSVAPPNAYEGQPSGCPGCGVSVRLSRGELERIIFEYFRDRRPELAPDEEAERRLALCGICPDLQYGSTCRHCGCLVELRARLADKSCPAPSPKW
jgi:hypothetical protein